MSTNGVSNNSQQQNDSQSGSSQQGRFNRNNGRRGRGRGNQERGNVSRGYRRQNYRETGTRPATAVNDVIDIHDSSQWPSIQESSNGVQQRPKQTATQPERVVEQQQPTAELDLVEKSSSDNRRQSYSRQPGPGQNMGGEVMVQQQQQPREYGRYNTGGRPRGTRYGQTRGYNSNYGRRYPNRPFIPFPATGYHHRDTSIMPGIFNGQIIFQTYPAVPSQPTAATTTATTSSANENKTTSLVDPVRQVEYYFSPQNLENDVFMRTRMDREGWVDVNVIHQFKRISNLNIPVDIFIEKLLTSDKLEVDKEKCRIRTRTEPEKWFLPEGASIEPPKKFEHPYVQYQPSYDPQYGPVNFSTIGTPYGAIQPMFIPVQGYPRGSRGRYIQHYNMYQPAYSTFGAYDMGENYYYPGDFGSDQYYYDPSGQGMMYGPGEMRAQEYETVDMYESHGVDSSAVQLDEDQQVMESAQDDATTTLAAARSNEQLNEVTERMSRLGVSDEGSQENI